MNTIRTMNLSFKSNTGDTISFTVPRADAGMTGFEAESSMLAVITNGSVLSKKGYPTAIRGATLFTRDISPIQP